MPGNNRRVDIDHDGPEPVYLQLADIIRGRILSGGKTGVRSEHSYPPDTPVPSIERIRQETGLAVKTIRRGIGVLATEGWVRIVPGKGTFVTPQSEWPDS